MCDRKRRKGPNKSKHYWDYPRESSWSHSYATRAAILQISSTVTILIEYENIRPTFEVGVVPRGVSSKFEPILNKSRQLEMAASPRYHEVPVEGDSEKGETDQFITESIQSHQRQQQPHRGGIRNVSFLGLIAAFCLGSLSTATIGYFQSGIQATSYGLYEKGWIEEKISK